MISFTKSLNLFILILLITSFNEVTSAVIKRDGQSDDFCKGFKITYPTENVQVKNNTVITVTWEQGGSKIVNISDLELFTKKGLITILWEGEKHFDADGTAKLDVKVFAPPYLNLPATDAMIRTWGSTSSGPNCFVLTPEFTLTP